MLMKSTLRLTSTEVGVWITTLRAYDQWIVFRAILRVGLSRKDFVNLGEVVSDCSEIRAEHARYGVASFPSSLRRIAEQFGAVIDPPPQQEKPKAIGQRTLSKTKTAFREAAARLKRKRDEALSEVRPAAVVEPEPLPDTGARLSPEARYQLLEAMNNAAAKRRRI